MEKIEADIFNILHNTKIRLQGDAEDNYGFMGKGYAEKLAVEIVKEIQLSEKKALSREEILDLFQTFQLTVDEYREKDFPCIPEWNFTDLINAIHAALPSEKKALSREDIVELLKGHFGIREYNRMMAIAQAIHSAIPAQREVSESCGCCGSKMVYIRGKFPKEDNRLICPCCAYERLEEINNISSKDYGKSYQAIDEFKKLNGG